MEVKPGYKHTKVGIIPEDWEVLAIGDFASFTSGKGIKVSTLRERSSDFPIPVYGGNGIAGYTTTPLLPRRSVIVGRVGQKCGEVHVTDGPAWVTDNALYPKHIRQPIDIDFLALALKAAHLNDLRNRNDLPLVTQSILHALRVAWPPTLVEQKAVATALNDMDELLNALGRLIAKKRDLKEAAIQQLLTGQTRLPAFHGKWDMRRLGDVADTDPENLGTDTPLDFSFNYIALEDVDHGRLRSYSRHFFRSAPSRARRTLRPNDVLVSTVRPNLQSHLLFSNTSGRWVCSTGFCVVRCRAGVSNPMYLFSHLFAASVNRQIEALLTGSNYPAINSRDVRALQIPMPGYQEQAAISAILSDIDEELDALEQRLDKTRAVKQAMMQELLTGKTRLVSKQDASHA